VKFERSKDWPLIKSIVTDPKIYPWVSDDFSPKREAWEPIQDPAVWYVVVRDSDSVLGLWMLVPDNSICWKIHTCILPSAWGQKARLAAKELGPWVWDATPAMRVNTDVPAYNRLAYKFALVAGLKQFGVNPKSVMKNGKLHDQIMLGISRPGA
jgi:RimJ/RimL family protein N-acetyltransferase